MTTLGGFALEIPRKSLSLVALCAAGLVAACVPESTHPLADFETTKSDPALAGSWVATENDVTFYAHFLPRRAGPTEVVVVSREGGDTGGGYGVLLLVTSRIAEDSFMSLKFLVDDGKVADDPDAGYQLMRYRLADGELTVWRMSEDPVLEDVEQGRVAGEAERGKWTKSVRLTAGTAELAAYVRRAGPARVFGTRFATFRRLD